MKTAICKERACNYKDIYATVDPQQRWPQFLSTLLGRAKFTAEVPAIAGEIYATVDPQLRGPQFLSTRL